MPHGLLPTVLGGPYHSQNKCGPQYTRMYHTSYKTRVRHYTGWRNPGLKWSNQCAFLPFGKYEVPYRTDDDSSDDEAMDADDTVGSARRVLAICR